MKLRDGATGELTVARVGLYDAGGRMPLPSDDALTIARLEDHVKQLPLGEGQEIWPTQGRYIFYVDESYAAELPAGRYDLVVSKGPEYRMHRQRVEVQPNQLSKLTIDLQRWIHMPNRGWYSGDTHIHVARQEQDNIRISAQMRAEDIHFVSLLQMSNLAQYYFPQYAFGPAGHFVANDYALVSGQESPRTGHRGHTAGLNGSRYHHPENYFLYHETAEAVRTDGGLFGYVHLSNPELFHVARGLAMDVPMNIVDFVEIFQVEHLELGLWYDFLILASNSLRQLRPTFLT